MRTPVAKVRWWMTSRDPIVDHADQRGIPQMIWIQDKYKLSAESYDGYLNAIFILNHCVINQYLDSGVEYSN